MRTADEIIDQLGGPGRAAELLGVHRTRVYSWVRDGMIPAKRWPAIIAASQGKVSAGDFLSMIGSAA